MFLFDDRLDFGFLSSMVAAMIETDIGAEPLKTIYIAMTDVIEEAVAAQERGDIVKSRALCDDASVLGRAAQILASRSASTISVDRR